MVNVAIAVVPAVPDAVAPLVVVVQARVLEAAAEALAGTARNVWSRKCRCRKVPRHAMRLESDFILKQDPFQWIHLQHRGLPPVRILLVTMRKSLMFQNQISSALHCCTWKPPINSRRQYLWSSSALSAAFVAPTAAALCVHVCTRQAAGRARQETPVPAGTAARVAAV